MVLHYTPPEPEPQPPPLASPRGATRNNTASFNVEGEEGLQIIQFLSETIRLSNHNAPDHDYIINDIPSELATSNSFYREVVLPHLSGDAAESLSKRQILDQFLVVLKDEVTVQSGIDYVMLEDFILTDEHGDISLKDKAEFDSEAYKDTYPGLWGAQRESSESAFQAKWCICNRTSSGIFS